MTVSYQYQVASSTSGGFTRLLFMWKGSLYKLIYRELLLFLFLFGAISTLYRVVLTELQKRDFEKIVVYCDALIQLIPLSFVLGFYVSYVARRWWDQYTAIPWPDKVMHLIALYVTGDDEYGRMVRRSLMRYLNLSLILVLRSISSAVKRRYPTLEHVVNSGFMTSLELELFLSVPSLEFNTYWIPCTWFVNLLKEARAKHRLPDKQGLKIIMELMGMKENLTDDFNPLSEHSSDYRSRTSKIYEHLVVTADIAEFNNFRSKCGLLWSYDWVSIPLVYTQVVTLATYSFFAVALIGRQYIEGGEKQLQLKIDIYLPLFTILQFFFFMGLLKVAEQLINPFGDDDEDFELNWLIDRHTKVSYLGVDTLMNRCPPLVKDNYFDAENITLPYTEAAAAYKKKTYRGSVANMTVPEGKQTMFLPEIVEEEEDHKSTPTRTSTISLAPHPDSPVVNRRQISWSPGPVATMGGNRSETILQLDLQDFPTSNEQADTQRRSFSDTVRKFSANIVRCSTPRIDLPRKPFFPLAKSTAKVTLQPWPSATSLSQSGRQLTRSTSSAIVETRRGSAGYRLDPHRLTPQPPAVEVSAYDENGCPSIDNFTLGEPEDESNSTSSSASDLCRYQCHHAETCRHVRVEQTSDAQRRSSGPIQPRFLRRQESASGSGQRKEVHWKSSTVSHGIRQRRRTAESLPPLRIQIPHTRSFPNLRTFEYSTESKEGTASTEITNEKTDSLDKSDSHTKL